ncbi:MAG: hypothetical protein P9L92_17645, partial [Candidatus Electryonea clarkiae]|nr:hypothetical protein [Candidatus Electryonea clarkiae]
MRIQLKEDLEGRNHEDSIEGRPGRSKSCSSGRKPCAFGLTFFQSRRDERKPVNFNFRPAGA